MKLRAGFNNEENETEEFNPNLSPLNVSGSYARIVSKSSPESHPRRKKISSLTEFPASEWSQGNVMNLLMSISELG